MRIYSIFGQIEEVAANRFIEKGKARRIPSDEIPQTARYNEQGHVAKFAVMFTDEAEVVRFEEMIADLRA